MFLLGFFVAGADLRMRRRFEQRFDRPVDAACPYPGAP